jgi:hypothetical protein
MKVNGQQKRVVDFVLVLENHDLNRTDDDLWRLVKNPVLTFVVFVFVRMMIVY